MKLVSIIVPIYNAELYLNRSIESLINQTYRNLEIILINDGSIDKSGDICDRYSNTDDRIKVIHKDNEGVSKARNDGLNVCQGEYIGFMDADDYFKYDMIEKMVKSIEKNKSDLAICNYFYNKETDLADIMDVDIVMEKILAKEYFRGFVFNKLYRKNIIDNLRFNEKIYIAEDLLFNCEYLLKCKKCSYVNEKLYYYCNNDYSTLNKKMNSKYLSILDAYKKIEDIYKNNFNSAIVNVYIDVFKITCDILYKNSRNSKKDSIDITNVLLQKKKYYKLIMKENEISILKKAEVFIYNIFPVFIGKLKNLKKRLSIKFMT